MGKCLQAIVLTLAVVAGVLSYFYASARRGLPIEDGSGEGPVYSLPSRESMIEHAEAEPFDLVIIGGGATGVASALEAQARGLSVVLLEGEDFGAGTSSRSTKLLHGGVRYLRKAIERHDMSQYHLVREALRERHFLFSMAPHLSRPLPILTPVYSKRDLIENYALLKLYDMLSFPKLKSSVIVSSERIERELPALKTEGLVGGIAYYDGVFDDARMDLAFALTCAHNGAPVLNHAMAEQILHNEAGNVSAVVFRDMLTNKTHTVRTRGIINAAGHFADHVRLMDNPEAKSVLTASAGVHIILDRKFLGVGDYGIFIPRTDDGRVLFAHPWHNFTLLGTTDSPTEVVNNPHPTPEAIEYLLNHAKRTLNGLEDAKVLSSWAGIRPLKRANDNGDTAAVSREHGVFISPSGLLTVVGGKWTTTRVMAEDILNKAVAQYGFDAPAIPESSERSTTHAKLLGAAEYSKNWVNETGKTKYAQFDEDILRAINDAYGDQNHLVLDLALNENLSKRLVPGLPFIEAQVIYGARHEYAYSIIDFLVRRTALALVSSEGAAKAIPRVGELLSHEFNWSPEQTAAQVKEAYEYLAAKAP